ncbi:hypothetical protein [Hymenobacter nivis]|uniref:Zinc-ribbon 15 domain-containing protein n=1 Tax=Hymenobacter nivis TaxID=1850093 RepID=A0A502GTW7_9BACT|nr:hypothetical protein [Hymenobacter nivis]TPG65371.1 hypothetical protein EAH73_12905 [Hymenobacter nivis]
MIFFYGTGSSCVATEPLPGLACAHCGTPDALVCSVYSRYLKLMFLPVFPIGKRSVTVCGHCKQQLTGSALPAAYRAPVQAVQSRARTPIFHFAGLLLVGALVVFIFAVGLLAPARHALATQTKYAGPTETVGAHYRVDAAPSGVPYILAGVTRVTPDSVYCNMSNPLRGTLSAASAAQALRDSVASNGARGFTAAEWHAATTAPGPFKRVE